MVRFEKRLPKEHPMAVTTTYSWQFVKNLDITNVTSGADAAALANGGFAGIGNHNIHIDGNIFNASGVSTNEWTSTNGTNGALDQLSNGNLVIASTDSDGTTLFKIVNSVTGNEVVATVDLSDLDQSEVDVAALTGGGFWVVATDEIGAVGGDADIDVFRRNNDGSVAGTFTIDQSNARDTGASIAALDGGDVAIAWTRTVGAETEIWYAVYDATGGVVKAAALLDSIGTINRNVSITATDGGGFAVAYEDNGWLGGNVNITLGLFDSAGTFLGFDNVSASLGDNANPTVTRISNGMLAVAYGNNNFPDTDTQVRLIDPNTGANLALRNVTGGESVADDTDFAAIAGFGLGRLAVFQTNLTDNNVAGEDIQAARTSTGDAAADVIVGDELVDIMFGAGGVDSLSGGLNNDELSGGADGDTLDGGAGSDTAQYLLSNAAVTVGINAGGTVTGGHATGDVLIGIENLTGSSFADTLFGNSLQNSLRGSGGADSLNASNNNDTLYGEDGDDLLIGGAGADLIDGGANDGGGDTVSYVTHGGATGMTINLGTGLATGNSHGAGDTLVDIENAIGSSQNDTITGDGNNNVLTGGNGLDTLHGGDGADTLNGSNGDDTIISGLGADANNGGGGLHDLVDYTDSNLGVVIDLRAGGVGNSGHAQGDTWSGVEDVTGSTFGDSIFGSTAANILLGGLGNDTLYGSAGADVMNGGGSTDDFADYYLSSGAVFINLLAGTASGGHAQGDTLFGIENLTGSDFNDTLTGNNLVNFIFGGVGNDTLNGNGNGDFLNGGAGNDTLNGGTGADTFTFQSFWGQDTINGWVNGQDQIQAVGVGLLTHADFTETQVGADTVLALIIDPTRTIRITNTLATTIDQGDFV